MRTPQKALLIGLSMGLVTAWGLVLWLFTARAGLQLELDTYVRLAAQASATEAVGRGVPHLLQASNTSPNLSRIVATNNGVPVRLYPAFSARDTLFVEVFNARISELLDHHSRHTNR